MATETVTVDKVERGNGEWFEITLTDDRVVSTKDKAIAEKANATRGAALEAELSEPVVRGKYTTIYINSLDGVGRKKAAGNGGGRTRSTSNIPAAAPRGGRDPEVQEQIRKQWAFGRAVELLALTQEEISLPLSDDVKSKLDLTAGWLLDQTK